VLKAILRTIWNRQVAKHGSVAALALGALSSALGIPLAPEQISLLITAFSVVTYLLTQIRALWRPKPAALAIAALMIAGELVAAHDARAEIHTATFYPPTQKEDGSSLDLALLHSWRVQCGIGSSSTAIASWAINDEVAFPSTTRDYDFKPNGSWVCRAWVIATYSCASMQTPDGAWTFGSGGDQYGNDIDVNGGDATGTAVRLVYTAGKTYAEAGSGLTPDDPAKHSWWTWGGPTMPWWSGPETAPTIAASDPQLRPSDPPMCQSANSADLVFTIPMNSTQKTSNAKPKAGSLSLSHTPPTP
jgi:hypothetical protein